MDALVEEAVSILVPFQVQMHWPKFDSALKGRILLYVQFQNDGNRRYFENIVVPSITHNELVYDVLVFNEANKLDEFIKQNNDEVLFEILVTGKTRSKYSLWNNNEQIKKMLHHVTTRCTISSAQVTDKFDLLCPNDKRALPDSLEEMLEEEKPKQDKQIKKSLTSTVAMPSDIIPNVEEAEVLSIHDTWYSSAMKV
jgi:hypothetical protein